MNDVTTPDLALELLRLMKEPQTFECLVDQLPDPEAIFLLKHWGFLHGVYPLERLPSPGQARSGDEPPMH